MLASLLGFAVTAKDGTTALAQFIAVNEALETLPDGLKYRRAISRHSTESRKVPRCSLRPMPPSAASPLLIKSWSRSGLQNTTGKHIMRTVTAAVERSGSRAESCCDSTPDPRPRHPRHGAIWLAAIAIVAVRSAPFRSQYPAAVTATPQQRQGPSTTCCSLRRLTQCFACLIRPARARVLGRKSQPVRQMFSAATYEKNSRSYSGRSCKRPVSSAI